MKSAEREHERGCESKHRNVVWRSLVRWEIQLLVGYHSSLSVIDYEVGGQCVTVCGLGLGGCVGLAAP